MDLDDFDEFEMEEMGRMGGNNAPPGMNNDMFDDPLQMDFGGMDSSLPPLSSLQTNMFSTPDVGQGGFHNTGQNNPNAMNEKRGRVSSLFACCLFCILLLCILGLLGLSIAVLIFVINIKSDIHNLKFNVQVDSNTPPPPLPPGIIGVY